MARGTKSPWKLLITVAIVCGVVVFAAGFLHRRAAVDALAKQQARSTAVAKAMTGDVKGVNLTKEAKGADEKALEGSVRPPAGTDVAIFSLDGVRVYATAGARIVTGDKASIVSAAKGNVVRVVSGNDLVVYAAIPAENKGNVAVAAVVSDYQKVLDTASGPLDAARMPLTALGILLFVAGLLLFSRERKRGAAQAVPVADPAKAAKGSRKLPFGGSTKTPKESKAPKDSAAPKGRVTGFEAVPVTAGASVATQSAASPAVAPTVEQPEATEPAGKRFSLGRKSKDEAAVASVPEEAPKKRGLFGRKSEAAEPVAGGIDLPTATDGDAALQREVAIRQALEDQLEQLRTRLQTQEEQASTTIRDLREQLEASQHEGSAPTVGPAEQDMVERLRTMETELAQARQAAAEATAQAASMQQELAAASTGDLSTAASEMESQIQQLQLQLVEAQRGAMESEQRAQSIESVRGELEVRVAQLGSRAGELEHKAEQLETRLREANEGGDAVRAEIASLTAGLAAAEARAAELETAAAKSADAEAEIARLRGELGKQMERAQVAEERVATLEADVLAAEHGVEELSDASDAAAATDVEDVEPATTDDERVPVASPFARLAELDERAAASESAVRDTATMAQQVTVPQNEDVGRVDEPSFADEGSEPEAQGSVEPVLDAQAEPEPAVEAEPEPVVEAEAETAPEPEPEPVVEAEAETAPEPEPEPEPVVEAEAETAPEPEPEPVVEAEAETAPEPEPEAVVEAEAETAPEPQSEYVIEAEAETAPDPEPETLVEAEAETAPEPEPEEPQVQQKWRQEWHQDSESGSASEPERQQLENPPAPSDADRYDDVWAAAFPVQHNGSQEPSTVEDADTAPEPSEDAATESPAETGSRMVSSSLDDEPSAPEDNVSVEDDLWALRARLAHAGETEQPRQTPPAPSWS